MTPTLRRFALPAGPVLAVAMYLLFDGDDMGLPLTPAAKFVTGVGAGLLVYALDRALRRRIPGALEALGNTRRSPQAAE